MPVNPQKKQISKSNGAFIKQLAALLLLFDLSVISLAGLSLYKSKQQFTKQATITTQNLSHVLERYINGELGKIEAELTTVAVEVEEHIVRGTIDIKALVPHKKRKRQSAELLKLVAIE